MLRQLQDLKKRCDPATRRRDLLRWRVPTPAWMPPHDDFRVLYRNLEQILEEGELTWGVVFMANSELWEAGEADLPMGLLYSFDPWFQRRPERLMPIAERVFAFHESEKAPPRRPWERAVFDSVHTGYKRIFHLELPPSLSGGRVVYESSTMAPRSYLPDGVLGDSLLPLLVQRHHPPRACLPVPSFYWPTELLHRWSH